MSSSGSLKAVDDTNDKYYLSLRIRFRRLLDGSCTETINHHCIELLQNFPLLGCGSELRD